MSLIIAERLPADRMSTGRIAETALGIQVQNLGLPVCVAGCLGIVAWNLLRDPTKARPLWPLALMLFFFSAVAFSNLAASGGEVRSGSRIALLLALTIWSIQPRLEDLRLLGIAGLVIVAICIALLPSGKAWMPSADIVIQEKALIGTQLMAGPFGQSNVLGMAFGVTMPFVFLFRRAWTRVGAFALMGYFLILTGSRSTIIGLAGAVVIAFFMVCLRDRLLSGAVALVGAVGLVVVSFWLPLSTMDPQAFTQRGSIWMISRSTWTASTQSFLFGQGLGYYGIGGHFALFDHGSPTYHGHNELLSLMTTSGAVALVAFLAIVATALSGLLRSWLRGRQTGLFAVLVLLGCSIAETPLRIDAIDSLGWLTWFSLFAILVAATGSDEQRSGQELPPPRSMSRSLSR
ncbi:O-antigen ligase [Microbacterium sp. BH-3-3-3]|uniref:O-antigen ligase family protein n=1 Tax=Microbacterium sp. BH-3-3-3 TaxID=1906742 RepID=UPI0011A9FF4E|nr:O-antigen ligase family protein [Microbacterium sp. BH-3-3-3]